MDKKSLKTIEDVSAEALNITDRQFQKACAAVFNQTGLHANATPELIKAYMQAAATNTSTLLQIQASKEVMESSQQFARETLS